MCGSVPFFGPRNLKTESQSWGTMPFRGMLAGPAQSPEAVPTQMCFHWGSGNPEIPCRPTKTKLCGSGPQLRNQTVQPRGPSLRGNSMNLSGN